jgi:CRP/FNR family transcriptional regulator
MYAHAAIATAVAAVPAANAVSFALCHGIERQAAVKVAAAGAVHKVEAGKTLFAEGDAAENVYEVVSGMVKLFKLLPDGRRQITEFLWAGDIMGVAHPEQYLYGAEAVTEVVVSRYSRPRFERLIDEVPGLARRLLAVTSKVLSVAQEQMLLLGRKTAAEKIATFLLGLADRQATAGEVPEEVTVPMGRSDIADHLGLTTETVSRTLTKLKQDGVIALPNPTRISIEDRDRLEELASGDGNEDF